MVLEKKMSGQDMVVKKLTVLNGCEIEDYTKIKSDLTVEGDFYAQKGINVGGHSFTGEQLKRAVDGFDGMLDKWDGEPTNKCLRLDKKEDDDTKWDELYHNTNKDDTGEFLIANAIASRQQIATPTGFIAQTNEYKPDGTDLGMKHRSFMVPNAVGTENLLTDNIYPLNGDTVTVQADNLAVNNLTAADGNSINVKSKINLTGGVGDLDIDNLTVNDKTTLGPNIEFTGDKNSSITYPGTFIADKIQTTGDDPTIMKDIKTNSISSATEGGNIALNAPVEGAEVVIRKETNIRWDESTKNFYRFTDKKPDLTQFKNEFLKLSETEQMKLFEMNTLVYESNDFTDIEILCFSQFTWCPNHSKGAPNTPNLLLQRYHCLNEIFWQTHPPQEGTLDKLMYDLYNTYCNNSISNNLLSSIQASPLYIHKILLYYERIFDATDETAQSVFKGLDLFRNLYYDSTRKKWSIELYYHLNLFETMYYDRTPSQSSLMLVLDTQQQTIASPGIYTNYLTLLAKGLILGTYTYIWYNGICNGVPNYAWGRKGRKKSIISPWSENIENVDNIFDYIKWWIEPGEVNCDVMTVILEKILSNIISLSITSSEVISPDSLPVRNTTLSTFYVHTQPSRFAWVVDMTNAEIDYTISASNMIIHVMEITNTETGERKEVTRISSRVLAIPEIQIALLHGDTQLTGKLTVDNISSSGTDPVNINYADIKQLMINGQVIKPCTSNIDCSMGYVTDEYTIYPGNDIAYSNEDVGSIGHVNNAAKVYVDYNNCGNVHFITIRPIIIKDNKYDGKKLFDYYKPNFSTISLTPEVSGRFTLNFKMNPYSFPVIPRTRVVSASQGSSQGNPIIPPAIFKNGTKPITNGANYYLLATTRYNLIQELIKQNQESQYYVKEMGFVEFFTVESRTNTIFLRWTRQQPDKNGTSNVEYTKPEKYKDYVPNNELLAIDGFSFTAHDQNSGETEYKQYYQNTSYGDKN